MAWRIKDTMVLLAGEAFFSLFIILGVKTNDGWFILEGIIMMSLIGYLALVSHTHTEKLLRGERVRNWFLP